MIAAIGSLWAMNIAIKPHDISAERALDGKVSLVTGSTSGIGLGIAQALAAAGSDVVLNGFGKPRRGRALADGNRLEVRSPRDLFPRRHVEATRHPRDDRRPYCNPTAGSTFL